MGTGLYEYKAVHVKAGTFESGDRKAARVQETIDTYVQDGWELWTYRPIVALSWEGNVLVFRRPEVATSQ